MKKEHYCSLKVKEQTRRLARELSGKTGIPIKDYIQLALEKSKESSIEVFVEKKKKKNGFNFDFRF